MGASRHVAERRTAGRSAGADAGSTTGPDLDAAAGAADGEGSGGGDPGDPEDGRESGAGGARAASGGRPELVDATHYDLDRLERAIRALVAQQQALLGENERLRVGLRTRDAEVERLTGELDAAVERRKHALERVDALIDELDRLDARLDEAMVDWVEDADGAGSSSGPPG